MLVSSAGAAGRPAITDAAWFTAAHKSGDGGVSDIDLFGLSGELLLPDIDNGLGRAQRLPPPHGEGREY